RRRAGGITRRRACAAAVARARARDARARAPSDRLAAEAAEDGEWVARHQLPGDAARRPDVHASSGTEVASELFGIVVVVRADEQERPSAHDRAPICLELV